MARVLRVDELMKARASKPLVGHPNWSDLPMVRRQLSYFGEYSKAADFARRHEGSRTAAAHDCSEDEQCFMCKDAAGTIDVEISKRTARGVETRIFRVCEGCERTMEAHPLDDEPTYPSAIEVAFMKES